MVICPIAVAVGCKRCPAFAVCPLKTVIGDYKPDEHSPRVTPEKPARASGRAASPRLKTGSNRKGARARRPRK
jgi:hypothetical protein